MHRPDWLVSQEAAGRSNETTDELLINHPLCNYRSDPIGSHPASHLPETVCVSPAVCADSLFLCEQLAGLLCCFHIVFGGGGCTSVCVCVCVCAFPTLLPSGVVVFR